MKKTNSLKSDELSATESEELRSHLTGWKEDSDLAEKYNKLYQQKKALHSDLDFQQEKASSKSVTDKFNE